MAKLPGMILCIYFMAELPSLESKRQSLRCYNKGFKEERCLENQTECGVNSRGASIGCVTKAECGAVANMGNLTCDVDQKVCCCQAKGSPCNNYSNRDFETKELCEKFPDATICLVDAEIFTEHSCKLPDYTDEKCKNPKREACATDIFGRPIGCKQLKDCPDPSVYFFDPSCDYEMKLCCCAPLAEIICNDRTQSEELDSRLRELEERMKKEDIEVDFAMPSIDLGKKLILIMSISLYFIIT